MKLKNGLLSIVSLVCMLVLSGCASGPRGSSASITTSAAKFADGVRMAALVTVDAKGSDLAESDIVKALEQARPSCVVEPWQAKAAAGGKTWTSLLAYSAIENRFFNPKDMQTFLDIAAMAKEAGHDLLVVATAGSFSVHVGIYDLKSSEPEKQKISASHGTIYPGSGELRATADAQLKFIQSIVGLAWIDAGKAAGN